MTRFIDREPEKAELTDILASNGPHLLILYGRRRIGKTYLLRNVWDGRRVFYFLAAETTGVLNRAELLRDLSDWSGRQFDARDYPTWRTVFRVFVELARAEPLIVVLDEFQHLLGQEDDAASQLAAVWDTEAMGTPLTVALSGSEVSVMQRLLSGGQALYGRANWSARLRQFDYYSASDMVEGRPAREQAQIYGIFGGTPRYLDAIRAGESLDDAVVRTFLSPRGEVNVQMQTLIEQERGIREPAVYRSLLTAVANGQTGVNDIAQAAGLGGDLTSVRHALSTLENLELVDRERNFASKATSPYRYRVSDNAVRFWYRFVHPSRSLLETADPATVWKRLVRPYLDVYMGKVFERIVRDAYLRLHEHWNLPGPKTWARWEGNDRNRRSIELDLVSELDDGRLMAGEIKWSSRPVSVKVHYDLLHDLDDLAHSGHAWARRAADLQTSAGFLYVSAAGFEDAFLALAESDPRVILKTLDDLYQQVHTAGGG